MLEVDGAAGEGGGQIVRYALTLGAATGQPVRVKNARAHRPKPGLRPQHATAARALAEVTDGTVHGAHVGSPEVTLEPGTLIGGDYKFVIDTAGSLTLLLQALLPACAASRQRYTFELEGGTDVPYAPTWDYFHHVTVPALERMGLDVEVELERRGYFPAGGGRARVTVDAGGFRTADFLEPGNVRAVHAVAHSHGLPKHVIERAGETVRDQLAQAGLACDLAYDYHRGPGRGMGVGVWVERAQAVLGGDAIGARGKRAETVALDAVTPVLADHKAGVPVDTHLSDQLPVFQALAGGGAFRTRKLTRHARTVLDLVPQFLPLTFKAERAQGSVIVRAENA